jgi:hypothetical protein
LAWDYIIIYLSEGSNESRLMPDISRQKSIGGIRAINLYLTIAKMMGLRCIDFLLTGLLNESKFILR